MNLKFTNKKISGILSIVPENRLKFLDEIDNYGFSREKSLKLQEVMGFDEHRIVEGNECASDLCFFGLEYLFENGLLNKNDIGALIFISQTPDHFMPPTSAILHGKLGLGQEVLCFDINHGCTAYLYGLLEAFLLLHHSDMGKIILMNADTLSRCACPNDRNIWPLIGDAGSITVIENANNKNDIFMNLRIDGTRYDSLIIPAGAFRIPSTEETREVKKFQDGNQRSEEHLHMNGPAVFTFTQIEVPRAIKELFEFANISMNTIEYFLFHQPNKFILQKLARKIGIPKDKMPCNIAEKYGSPSGASIPLTTCDSLRHILHTTKLNVCMSGFGVGLSWGALTMELGPLEFCELLEK
ncbi:MAG: 3-oxoacyl-[acyl-carrier-protein] synthase III C-terminal domain-containing protein [bacterium]